MLNLYQIQSFVTVLSEGSMTAAAEKLFLTQPAISQQIRNLEEDLGVDLLVRGVRQIKPTLQGEVLFDYAKRILQMAQQAEVAVKAMGAELNGQLRVGTLDSVGVQLMSPIASRLLKHNPELNIKIEYGKGEELIRKFNDGEIDVLVLPEVETEYHSTVEADKKFLFKEEMWLVGTGKDSDMPKQISAQEYTQYPIILFTGEYPHFNESLNKMLKSAKVEVEPTFEATNVGTLKRVVESGLGWGFLPSLAIKKQVRMGRLNHVLMKEFKYDIEFYFYSKKVPELKAITDVLYQALQQQERS
ncbi:MAG: LysR family transcriptional regulator [Bdellovibrio sp. CG10_big_fil_rev_8_21_14_0_10_47_8]|nr:MAG: LysR family transcriptional regulator [Bdellovibrio sp. CG10_big_fil_rev_8_21_14_0_10_47_8]